jgi:hypothetical protein
MNRINNKNDYKKPTMKVVELELNRPIINGGSQQQGPGGGLSREHRSDWTDD